MISSLLLSIISWLASSLVVVVLSTGISLGALTGSSLLAGGVSVLGLLSSEGNVSSGVAGSSSGGVSPSPVYSGVVGSSSSSGWVFCGGVNW